MSEKELVVEHKTHLFGLIESKYAIRFKKDKTELGHVSLYDFELITAHRFPVVGWVV